MRVGLAGAGQMGSGFVAQVQRIPGMEIGAIADVDPNRVVSAYKMVGIDPDSDGGKRHAVLTDAAALADADVDMVVDATGVPDVGAALSLAALRAGKHVGLLNVECDVTIGYLLAAVARKYGKVYTLCRGDEPAEAVRLVEFARDLAFEVVCAGKGKNNPLDQTATPDSLVAEATSKHMNPKMLCSFVDGSKAMIEMAALANGADLKVTKRGMNGPPATVPTLAEIFRPEADGGILPGSGYVDYCTGDVAPGVFVIVKADDPTVHEEMTYLKMGPGPYFTLYRPYHLASIEAPLSIGEAVLHDQASIVPDRLERRGRHRRQTRPATRRRAGRHRRLHRLRDDRGCNCFRRPTAAAARSRGRRPDDTGGGQGRPADLRRRRVGQAVPHPAAPRPAGQADRGGLDRRPDRRRGRQGHPHS